MSVHIHPAHVASLPVVLREIEAPAVLAEPDTPLACWCASIGRTAADVAALLFTMPATDVVRQIFEDEVRQTIAAELLARPLNDAERQHLEDVAWMAFDRRMDRHGWNSALAGEA